MARDRMPEKPKRLKPLLDTTRWLFAHSGNQCAFEDCPLPPWNHRFQFIGEVCHIAGAGRGGERFDPEMDNEDRRHRDNLVLLCHPHHVETDDVEEYPAERMSEIKRAHESQFAATPLTVSEENFQRVAKQIAVSAITDPTDRIKLRLPQTLDALNDHCDWGHGTEELAGTLADLVPIFDRVRKLPPDTRRIFALFLTRGSEFSEERVGVQVFEFRSALSSEVDETVLDGHLDALSYHRLATRVFNEETDDGQRFRSIEYLQTTEEWPFWLAFKGFCEAQDLSISDVFDELRFDVLDTGTLKPRSDGELGT